jgi:tetratricopeptide (TPR) repeat protein
MGVRVRIQLLGPVRVWRDGTELDLGPAAPRAVFGLLALAGGQPVPRAELVDALWGERPPASSTNVIQTHVKRLRAVLEPDRLPRTPSPLLPAAGDGYALHAPPDDVDLVRFRRLVAAAAGQRADPRRAADLLAEAVGLWQAQPLADIRMLAAHPKVLALSEERWNAVARYGEAMIVVGAAEDALPALEEAAAAQPLDETPHARLIRAYAAAGRRARAFAAYEEIRQRLVDELGVDPGPELAEAHASLLRPVGPSTGPALAASVVPAPRGPAPDRPVPAQLPADVPGFTGRAGELAELAALASTVDGAPAVLISAVSGMAGVGKTALAVRWAHRVRRQFPDGQLFLDLRGYDPARPVRPGAALARFLSALGLSGVDIPLDEDEAAATYRSLLDGRRVLVVLDNAASVEQVRPLLPGSPTCLVLVTSRDPLPGLIARHGARRLTLDVLPPDEAVGLLRGLVGSRVDSAPAAAAALARQCGWLPLALRVAAEVAVARAGTPLPELVAELADEQHRLDLLTAGGDPHTAVRTVFSWSYQHLPVDAGRLFRLLGLHPGPDVDGYGAAALAGESLATAERLLGALAEAHLVRPAAAGRYGMHDLLRAYAAGLAASEDPAADRAAAQIRLLDHYLATAAAAMDILYPAERRYRPRVPPVAGPAPALGDRAAAQAWLDRERPAIVAAVLAAGAGRARYVTGLSRTLFRYLDAGGHYPDGLAVHNAAREAAEQAGDRTAQAHALTSLGAVYHRLGRYPQAADRYGQAIGLFLDAGDPIGEARTLANLGAVREWQGGFEEAAEHYQRALVGYRVAADNLGEARMLTSLGAVRRRQGRYPQAAEHYRQALELHRANADRVGEARALTNLGLVWLRQGQLGLAGQHQQRALALYRACGDRGGEAYALDNLGLVRQRQGDFGLAAEHHQHALAIYRETGDRDGEAEALANLGALHLLQRRYPAAIEHHRQALSIYREIGGRSGEVSARNGLGEALLEAGEPEAARAQLATALRLATEMGDRYEQARAHAGIAHTYPTGSEQARRHQDEALDRWRELGLPDDGSARPAAGEAVQPLSS